MRLDDFCPPHCEPLYDLLMMFSRELRAALPDLEITPHVDPNKRAISKADPIFYLHIFHGTILKRDINSVAYVIIKDTTTVVVHHNLTIQQIWLTMPDDSRCKTTTFDLADPKSIDGIITTIKDSAALTPIR